MTSEQTQENTVDPTTDEPVVDDLADAGSTDTVEVPKRFVRTDGVTAYYAIIRGHTLVAFGRCPDCHESVKHCACPSPAPPGWTVDFLTAWVVDYPSESSPTAEVALDHYNKTTSQ